MTTDLRCEARGLRFTVRLDDALPAVVTDLFAGLAAPADARVGRGDVPDLVCGLAAGADGDRAVWDLTFDGESVMRQESLNTALDTLFYFLNARVIAHDAARLSLHAAAVAWAGTGVLLPAASGSGKSTMCARLLQLGCAYLTDESTGVGPDGELRGYPKPIGFKAGADGVLADVDLADLRFDGTSQWVWHVPVGRLTAHVERVARAGAIVFPAHAPGRALEVEPLGKTEAAFRVLANSQNRASLAPSDALDLVGALVAQSRCWSVTYADARDGAAAVLDRVRATVEPAVEPWSVVGPAAPDADARRDRPTPAPGVSALCFGDGAVLLDGATGVTLTTGAVGAAVWPQLGTAPLAELVARTAQRFGEDRAVVAAGLAPWLAELERHGFVLGVT